MAKFYKGKNSKETSEAIVRTNSSTDTIAREEVYSKNREALQYEFRWSPYCLKTLNSHNLFISELQKRM